MEKLDKIKKVIKENYNIADCGLFFTRNLANDYMITIYEEDGVTIDICTGWHYFEIFGLDKEEKAEIMMYYYSLEYHNSLKGE